MTKTVHGARVDITIDELGLVITLLNQATVEYPDSVVIKPLRDKLLSIREHADLMYHPADLTINVTGTRKGEAMQFTNEQLIMMETWLDDRRYGGIEAWAEQFEYASFKEPEYELQWVNEKGDPVDIHTELWQHICNIMANIEAKDWF